MERIDCNLCGASEHDRVYEMPDTLYHPDEMFTIVRCRNCGLGFVNPRPAQSEMHRYYPPSFYDDFEENSAYHRSRYARQAAYLEAMESRMDAPRLLDVGCATGGFPRAMRERGWQVEGVEISPVSERIRDFKVHRSILPDIDAEAESFDAVTAWAVLEHVHDPMAYFRTVGRVLKPGGRFVFLVTNFESVSSYALFREDVPRHLYFFTLESVRRYLNSCNLRLVEATTDDSIFMMVPIGWLNYRIRRMTGREWSWETRGETRQDYFDRRGLKGNLLDTVRYAATNPVSALDRLIAPIHAKYQMWTGRYGIVTFVAEKPASGMPAGEMRMAEAG